MPLHHSYMDSSFVEIYVASAFCQVRGSIAHNYGLLKVMSAAV